MNSMSIFHFGFMLVPIFFLVALAVIIIIIIKAVTKNSSFKEKPQTSTLSKISEIAALHELLTKGALSQEEFEAEKRKLLS